MVIMQKRNLTEGMVNTFNRFVQKPKLAFWKQFEIQDDKNHNKTN